MKKTIHGPNDLRIEIDTSEIFGDDPGAGTPAMVFKGKKYGFSATYHCALDTGELDGGSYQLTTEEHKWLNSQYNTVEDYLAEA